MIEQRTVNLIVGKLSTKNLDMKGLRCIKASDAVDKQDYITLNDLDTRLSASAYTDTTNADNITEGKLKNALYLPAKYTMLGAVYALKAVAHKFFVGLGETGNFQTAQPDFTDLTGTATSAQIPLAVKPPSSQTLPARAFGTIYQNTTAKPIYVTASVLTYVSGGNGRIDAYCDASVTPGTIVATAFNSIAGGTQLIFPMTFIVLPNYYYRIVVTSGGSVLFSWVEWN